jgi:hypothetical protein
LRKAEDARASKALRSTRSDSVVAEMNGPRLTPAASLGA